MIATLFVAQRSSAWASISRRILGVIRSSVAVILVLSVLLPGLTIAQDSDSRGVPMFRGNPARTGEMSDRGPAPDQDIAALWAFWTGDSIYASSAVIDGVVYVGSLDHALYAIDAASGQQLWAFSTGDSIYASPAVIDGVVYVGSLDNTLYAIDAASGQQLWTFSTGDSIYASPAVIDGVVYAGSDDGSLYAVDATTGQQRWAFPTGGDIWSSPAVVDGVVYVGSDDGNLYAVDAATGQQRWVFPIDTWVTSSPAVADGVVYVGSGDQVLYAVDATTGERIWAFPTDDPIDSSPAVVNGVVYVGSEDDALYAVDATNGQQIWTFPTGDWVDSSPAVADGVVYVGSYDNSLYAIDATTGQQIWAFQTSDWIYSSPAVADGVVYVGTGDGYLYAIGNPATPGGPSATVAPAVSATAEASVESTATQTGDSAAIARAVAVMQQRNQPWDAYFSDQIPAALDSALSGLPGMTISDVERYPVDSYIPANYMQGGRYQVSDGAANTWVALTIFPSSDDAKTAMGDMNDRLTQSGWLPQAVDGLDHDHTCFSIVHVRSSAALCYLINDDALIVSYSNLAAPSADAALRNAVDLARAMSDAYDQVNRPE